MRPFYFPFLRVIVPIFSKMHADYKVKGGEHWSAGSVSLMGCKIAPTEKNPDLEWSEVTLGDLKIFQSTQWGLTALPDKHEIGSRQYRVFQHRYKHGEYLIVSVREEKIISLDLVME